jgi:hypothetical protein
MNQNIAAGAANAPATVKALEEAQALYEAQTLARERQAAEETLRQQEAERAAAEEQEAQRLAEEEQTAAREAEERRKRYEAMRAEQSVKLELTPDESGATGAGMKEEIQPVSNLLAGTPLNDPSAPRVFRENSEALNRSQSIPVSREEAVDLIYSKVTQADGRQEDERFGPDPFDPGSGPSAGFITDNVGEMSQSLRRRAVEGDRILPEEAQQLWNEREVIRYAWGQEFNSNNRRTRSNWREGWTALHEPYDAPKGSGPGNLDAFYDVLSADEFLESEGLPKPPPPQPVKPKPAPQPITPTGEPQSIPLDQLTVIPEDMARAEASRDANDERWQRASQSKEPIRAIRRPDGTLRIMDGHHRYLAARDRGDASIPVTIEPPFTPAQGKPTDSLPADQPTSGDVGSVRDVMEAEFKPKEQQSPDEYLADFSYEIALSRAERDHSGKSLKALKKEGKEAYSKRAAKSLKQSHIDAIKIATGLDGDSNKSFAGYGMEIPHNPVSAEAVDTYGIKLPEGYVRQGELYVFQPTVTTPTETPAAPRSPAENLVSFTAANGQKLVGEVQSVTGNKATVAYSWNGKMKTQVVPVSQLGSPVASVATPPKYQYNQEQNTRKLGKHFPTALGVHANHDFRKSFASMAKDTSLGQGYQMIARMLSKMPEFRGMDLHLVADENIKYAGEYSWNKGKPSIAVNLRLIARGQVDALGSILHEALHHVTLAKVRNPQGAFENEVVSKLDLIRESVREYAESKGLGERLDYELGSTEEFITALFTRPDFQALIASIPDSAAPGVAVGKFRSLLSEIFRLIAELVHGKPVLRGSALEQAMTTSLALFNTPFRAIETGGLEALNAARSYAGERAQMPQFMRDSLETAQAMAAAGKTSEEIRAVTGWFPGKYDGKMRWEIPDEGAMLDERQALKDIRSQLKSARDEFSVIKSKGLGFTPEFNAAQLKVGNLQNKLAREEANGDLTTVGERLEHPALFAAYPAAKNIRLLLEPMQSNYGGYFDPISNKIAINSSHSKEAQISSLLHEVQHWIQKQENFAEGGDLSQFLYSDDFKLSTEDQAVVEDIDSKIAALREEEKGLGEFFRSLPDSMKGAGKSEKESRRLNTISSEIRDLRDKRYAITKPARNKMALDKYRRTAGEIESRDVQARQRFTPEQRKAVAPYSSENIAKEDAIVMFGGSGAQASMGKGIKALFPQTGDKAAKPPELGERWWATTTRAEARSVLEPASLEELKAIAVRMDENPNQPKAKLIDRLVQITGVYADAVGIRGADAVGPRGTMPDYTGQAAAAQQRMREQRAARAQQPKERGLPKKAKPRTPEEFARDMAALMAKPATGGKPINLSAAYQKAVTGKSSQWVSIKEVYEQAKADNPSLTPEAFMQFVQQQNDAGGVMISPVENVSTVEAAQPFVIGNAGVEMIVPSGTAASRIDEETDAEYLAAVEAGDMETAQRMVDAAAKAAGYNVGPVWHGTQSPEQFFEFKPRYGFINYYYFASNKGFSKAMSRRSTGDFSGGKSRVIGAMLKINNPLDLRSAENLADTLKLFKETLGEATPRKIANQFPLRREHEWHQPWEAIITDVEHAENKEFINPLRNALIAAGYDGMVFNEVGPTLEKIGKHKTETWVAFDPNQIKSADPVTYKDGKPIKLSDRFNPESPSILYAAPIDTQPRTGDSDAEAGGSETSAPISSELDARREEAISAAVAQNDWGNYTREQKVAAAESFLAERVRGLGIFSPPHELLSRVTAGDPGGSYVRVDSADSKSLGVTINVGQGAGIDKYANFSPQEVFAHLYDIAQEEGIHVLQYMGLHRKWVESGAKGGTAGFLRLIEKEFKTTFDQINKARIDLQQTDPAAAQKIKDAMLASWNLYHAQDPVAGISGLWDRLGQSAEMQANFTLEMVRMLTQLKRQDFTTETGWQKFRSMIKRWLTDAINALRGVQDVFRSGMAGDLIQRQLADLEAALDGKPLPPVSRPAASRADDGEGVIDIGGEAEPADGGGTQLFQKDPTAIGSTFITPADITLQERRSQEETLAKARKIIAEEVQKDKEGGRAIALQRFKTDLSIPPEVRALGSGLVAQQADLLANLELDAFKQEGLDALADQAGKVSGIIGSDYEYWRNLQLAANLDVDKMAEEAARTLNILSVFRRLTPEGFLRRMKRQYNATVQESISQNFDIPPGEVEAEIMRLWRMMQEAGATARGEAIAAALKAFMPRRVNTRRIIESLFPQAGTRQRMSKGGEALVRSFFQMMAGPRDQKGPLAEFDESVQNALSGMLRKVMEANGLVAKNQSNQATDIDKLVRSVSADELRFDKIAAADEAMQKELDAIEDPERRAVLQQAWEEATAKMYTNIASDATVRRAINSELKGINVDWRKMFDSNQKPDAIKAKVADAVMTKIEGLLTDAADPTVRQNLNMLRGEVEAAFDFIAANKRTEWLAYREGIEARRRVAEHRAAFMEALRNQGVAEDALLRISKKLLAGPLPQKPDRNPVSALVGEHMKEEVPNFVDKLVALDVDRATAEQLDTAAKALRADIAEVEKLKAAERAVKKLMDSLKPKPRAPREKIEKALKALFTAAETGALDSQEFFDALGEALGRPPLTAEQQAKIKKLTREINALPKGAARVDKQQELDEELALWKGIAARDVLLSAWYANILSGISTQGIGLFGNLANFLPRSLFLAATNPRSARAYFQGAFGEGLKTGLREAQAALKGRGLYKVSKYGDKNMVSALELLRKKGPATLPEWIAYIASGGTRLRYVFRIMQAIDALAWNTAREGQAYLAAHRALLDQQRAGANRSPEEFSRALIENLGGDAKQIEEDMRTAREELISRGQTPDLTTIARMAGEARNARRSSTVNKMSNRFADRIVMQQDPEGIGDVISSIITVIQKKGNFMGVPFGQLLIPFNKIVANLFEQSLDYTPVGALRSYLGGHLTDIQSIDWSGKVQFKDKSVQFDAVERAERMAASVTGTLAASVMFALASLFKDEPDEDVPFMLYGLGPESKIKRDQMPKGWTPFSAKIGDTIIKFSEMPFGVMFAAAGNALDAMRYKNMDNKSSAQRLAYVLKTSAKGFTEQGVLSSFDTALEVLTFQASDKKFTDVPVNVAKGMVPGQGMLRDISVLFDPVKIKDDTIAAAFLRDFPVVRRLGTRPALNVFGEPMTFDGRIPFVRRIATVREKHPVADYLGRNGLSIPGMAQTIVVGQYLPKDMKDRIQRRALQTSAMENGVFTVEQDYNFRKRAGELTKAAVEGLLTQVPTITSDRQRENVQNLINRKVEIARRRAMLEAVPAQ